MTDPQYVDVAKIESSSNYGFLGVKISVATVHKLDEEDRQEIERLSEKIKDLCLASIISKDPIVIERGRYQKKMLLSCFEQPIFVEEIPSGYCSQYCCKHLPWFIVTTKIGKIKIGWRKRVIHIDWADSLLKTSGKEVFSTRATTVGDSYVHASSYDDAKLCLNTIMQAYESCNKSHGSSLENAKLDNSYR